MKCEITNQVYLIYLFKNNLLVVHTTEAYSGMSKIKLIKPLIYFNRFCYNYILFIKLYFVVVSTVPVPLMLHKQQDKIMNKVK
jgi:uncharacterized membrane protein